MSNAKWALVVALWFFTLVGVSAELSKAPLRYEHLVTERQPYDEPVISAISAWHDRESGQEFTCVQGNSNGALMCFPTGRNWKDKK